MIFQSEVSWYKVDRKYITFLEQKYHTNASNVRIDQNLKYALFTITDGDVSLGKCPEKLDKLLPNERLMYILFENETASEDKILCKFIVDQKRNILKVTPDFTSGNFYHTLQLTG